jgi:hypothetical protein
VPESLNLAAAWRTALLALLLSAGGALAVTDAAAEAARPAAAAPQPQLGVPMHEAVYHATVRRIPVRATLRLERQNGGLFLYRSWVETRGALSFISKEVSETSLVLLRGDGGIVPISYRRRDDFTGRHSDMLFDHANERVNIDYRGEKQEIDWEPGIFDVLSLRLALARDLAQGGLSDRYRVVDDRGRVEEVDVEIVGRETLATPLGSLETIRLEYSNSRRDRMYRLWLAPALDAAVVRLEQYESGKLRGSLNLVEYKRL